MILKANQIANLLRSRAIKHKRDPLVITPAPDIKDLKRSGSASVDLRLGTWIVSMRQSRIPVLHVGGDLASVANKAALTKEQLGLVEDFFYGGPVTESRLTKMHYVPFGGRFILHPRNFVLGVTLEWIRLPSDLAAYVIGKSSWGRRGLIIATAAGVHPGFTGCLTLELSNLGEIPIAIKPGMKICQLFLHSVDSKRGVSKSPFSWLRRPHLGTIAPDEFADNLTES